jgi:hypothetical protein
VRRLETQADGRRFAVDVLRKLQAEGTERCRANLPAAPAALILALIELKERGTVESLVGFGVVFTDLAGTRSQDSLADLYAGMERSGSFRPYRLKRLLNAGHWIAIPAIRRETIEAGNRMPAKAEPDP